MVEMDVRPPWAVCAFIGLPGRCSMLILTETRSPVSPGFSERSQRARAVGIGLYNRLADAASSGELLWYHEPVSPPYGGRLTPALLSAFPDCCHLLTGVGSFVLG
jgi:hypothetical protein